MFFKMKRPELKKENVETLFSSKFVNVTDLHYEGLEHYYNVSRKASDDIAALKDDGQFKAMLPDAVTCIVIVRNVSSEKDSGPRLLLTREFRYPCGQFLLSPPAGLMDPSDRECACPQIETARREIKEETGLDITENDRIFVVSPLAFSSPGLTDESNGLVCAVADIKDESVFSTEGQEGTELIGDFTLVTKDEAKRLLKQGRDDEGIFYSVYTWMALMYFVSGLWEEEL